MHRNGEEKYIFWIKISQFALSSWTAKKRDYADLFLNEIVLEMKDLLLKERSLYRLKIII